MLWSLAWAHLCCVPVMTVSYSKLVSTSGSFGNFWKLLFRWCSSRVPTFHSVIFFIYSLLASINNSLSAWFTDTFWLYNVFLTKTFGMGICECIYLYLGLLTIFIFTCFFKFACSVVYIVTDQPFHVNSLSYRYTKLHMWNKLKTDTAMKTS